MKFACLFFCFTLFVIPIHAQNTFINRISKPPTYNHNRYEGNYNLKVLPKADKGNALFSTFDDSLGQRIFIRNYNECQNLIWEKNFILPLILHGGSWNYYRNNKCLYTEDHGFLITTQGNINGNTSLYNFPRGLVIKLDSNGKTKWAKQIFMPVDTCDILSMACTNGANNDLIIGITIRQNDIYSPYLFLIICLNKQGSTKWIKQYSTTVAYVFFGINQIKTLNTGGYAFLLAGRLLKTDTSGNLQWTRNIEPHFKNISNFDPDSGYVTYFLVNDISDNLYIANDFYFANDALNPGRGRSSVMKLDMNGNLEWFNIYTDSSKHNNNLCGMSLSTDNKLVLFSIDNTNKEFQCFKIDENGKIVWQHLNTINNKTYCPSYAFEPTLDSGFITSFTVENGAYDYIVKLDKYGSTKCNEANSTLKETTINYRLNNYKFNIQSYYIKIRDTSIITKDYTIANSILLCSSHPYPHAHLPKDTILCTDSTYTLLADSGNTGCHYLWSTGDTTSSIIAKKSGRYWVKVYYGYCSAYDTINVIIYKQYKSPLGKDKGICAYDSVKLQAPDTFAKWYWITPAKKKLYSQSIIAKDSGIYYLGFEGSASCKWVDTFRLSYYPRPKAIAGPDTLLCYNQEYTMQGAGGATYKWTPAKYLSSDTIPNPKAHLPNTQRYALIVHNTQGCVDTSYVIMKVRPALKVKISGDTSISCYGRQISLSAIGQGGYGPGYKYNWPEDSIAGNNFQKKLFKSAWHRVVLDDGCSEVATDSVYIMVAPKPKAAFIVLPGTKVNARAQLNFQNQSANALKYYWSFDAAGANSHDVSPYYFYSDSGTYKVRLIAFGYSDCSDTAYGQIEVIQGNATIYIPNTFTPNGDSLNEVFDINGTEIKEYTLEIYNRCGERLYTGDKGWDGSYHGTISPEGVYLYTIKVTDNFYKHHFFSGTVHLLK